MHPTDARLIDNACPNNNGDYVEIKCQLDATEVFLADLIVCSTFINQHPANRTHHPQLRTRPAT